MNDGDKLSATLNAIILRGRMEVKRIEELTFVGGKGEAIVTPDVEVTGWPHKEAGAHRNVLLIFTHSGPNGEAIVDFKNHIPIYFHVPGLTWSDKEETEPDDANKGDNLAPETSAVNILNKVHLFASTYSFLHSMVKVAFEASGCGKNGCTEAISDLEKSLKSGTMCILAHSVCPLGDKAGSENETLALAVPSFDPLYALERAKNNLFASISLVMSSEPLLPNLK